jgi:pilus assembly protein CpaF
VTHISEVLPLSEKGDYRTQPIWVFSPLGKDEDGNVIGYHAPTGIVPHFAYRLRASGFPEMDDAFFDPETYGLPAPPQQFLAEEFQQRWVPSLKHREKGQPDPEEHRQQLAALERKLREEVRQRPADPDTSPGAQAAPPAQPSPPPKARPAPPTPPPTKAARPPPKPAAPPPRLAEVDEDKTPPPTRNPLAQPAPVPDEPKVEIAPDYLDEAQTKDPTDRRPMPGRPAPPVLTPVARPATTGRRTAVPPAPTSLEDEPTGVRPLPEKPRK